LNRSAREVKYKNALSSPWTYLYLFLHYCSLECCILLHNLQNLQILWFWAFYVYNTF